LKQKTNIASLVKRKFADEKKSKTKLDKPLFPPVKREIENDTLSRPDQNPHTREIERRWLKLKASNGL